MTPLNITVFPPQFQGSSPHDQFLSKLSSLKVCTPNALLTSDKPLPPLEIQESTEFNRWIRYFFFQGNEHFKLSIPISVELLILSVYKSMAEQFQLRPETVALNGGGAPYFLPKSYLIKMFHLLGIESAEELLTQEILAPLNILPKDFDVKIIAPQLSEEQLKKMSDCFDKYLSSLGPIKTSLIKEKAYTKRKYINEGGNSFHIFGIKGAHQVDLIIAKMMKREKLFSHEFQLNFENLFLYNSMSVPSPKGSCQALIFRLAKVIHIENEQTINEFGWARVISYLTKGWRCFQKEKVDVLFEKCKTANPGKILEITCSNHHENKEDTLALFFNAKVFGLVELTNLIDKPPLASLLATKISDLIEKVSFPVLKNYLFFRTLIQWTSQQKLNDYKIETTLNFDQPMIQLYIHPECCLTLPHVPSKIQENKQSLLNASKEEKKHLLELEQYFSKIELHSKNIRKCYFEGIEEEELYEFMRLFQILNGEPPERTPKKSDSEVKIIIEKLISKNDPLVDDILNHAFILKYLSFKDYHLFLGKRVLLAAASEETLIKILALLPQISEQEDLHDELVIFYLKTALFLLNSTYILTLANKNQNFTNYEQYLNSGKNLKSRFEERIIRLLNTKLNRSNDSIDQFFKKSYLFSTFKIFYSIFQLLQEDSASKPLILAILQDYLLRVLEINTSQSAEQIGRICQVFMFIPPPKKPLDHFVHFKGSNDVLLKAFRKKFISQKDYTKLSLFFNTDTELFHTNDVSVQMTLIEELVSTVLAQNSTMHFVHLGEIFTFVQLALRKYPQRVVSLHKQICDQFEKRHGLELVRLKPVFEYLFLNLFHYSAGIGGFACVSYDLPFAKECFLNLFNATLSVYKTQLKKKIPSGPDFNIPCFLCKMIKEANKRGLFTKNPEEIIPLIQRVIIELSEGKDVEVYRELMKEEIDSVLKLSENLPKNLTKKMKDLFNK